MHSFDIPPTRNIELRVLDILRAHAVWQFEDAAGAMRLFVLLTRTSPRRYDLLANARLADGRWLREVRAEVEVPDGATSIVLRWRPADLSLAIDGEVVLRCDPAAAFEGRADIRAVCRMRTNIRPGAMHLATGAEIAGLRAVAVADGGRDALRVLGLGDEASAPLAGGAAATGVSLWDLNEAIEATEEPYLAIVSGDWEPAELEAVLAAYRAEVPALKLLSVGDPVAGETFVLCVPRLRDRVPVRAVGDVLVIDPGLASVGYWCGPGGQGAPSLRCAPGSGPPMTAPVPQVAVFRMAPVGGFELPAGWHDVTGPAPPRAPADLGRVLAKGPGLSSHVLIAADRHAAPRLRTLFLDHMFDPVVCIGDPTAPSGLLVRAEAVPQVARALAAVRRWPGQRPARLLGRVVERLPSSLEVARAAEAEPQAPDARAAAPILPAALVERLLDPGRPLVSRGELGPFRAALPRSLLRQGLISPGIQYAVRLDIREGGAENLDALLDGLMAEGAGFHGIEMLISVVRAAPYAGLAPCRRIVEWVRGRTDPADWSAEMELLAETLEITAATYDLADTAYLDAGLPAGGRVSGTTRILHANRLFHYLAQRGRWTRIADLFEEGRDTLPTTPELTAKRVVASFRCGRLEGLDGLIDAAHARGDIDAATRLRMRVELAQARGDEAAKPAAIDALLRSTPDYADLLRPPTAFERLTPARPPLDARGIACIMVVRNEALRLPWMLDRYRSLGVDRFLVIDNGSTDGSADLLAGMPDVELFRTAENYRDARYGVKWHNEIADRHAMDRWVLTVDADEALVWPGCETEGLRALCDRLEAEGAEALFTTMIDMYPPGRLDEAAYEPGDDLLGAFGCFDAEGYRRDAIVDCPYWTVSGGPRVRIFGGDRRDPAIPHMPMQKMPLVRWRRGFRYLSSTHNATPVRVSRTTGALLHFKFLPDFHARALEEVARGQHYEGAREYRIYAELLADPARRSFLCAHSTRYRDSAQLEALGLISRGPP